MVHRLSPARNQGLKDWPKNRPKRSLFRIRLPLPWAQRPDSVEAPPRQNGRKKSRHHRFHYPEYLFEAKRRNAQCFDMQMDEWKMRIAKDRGDILVNIAKNGSETERWHKLEHVLKVCAPGMEKESLEAIEKEESEAVVARIFGGKRPIRSKVG
jgi:hypothetical protein